LSSQESLQLLRKDSSETQEEERLPLEAGTRAGKGVSDWKDSVHALVNCRQCEIAIAL
jgi:hypothetical protein